MKGLAYLFASLSCWLVSPRSQPGSCLFFILGTKKLFVGSKATWHQPFALSHLSPYYRRDCWHEVKREKFAVVLLLGCPGSSGSIWFSSTVFFLISSIYQITCLFIRESFEKGFSHSDYLKKQPPWGRNISKVSAPFWIPVPLNWSSICDIQSKKNAWWKIEMLAIHLFLI